MGRGKKRHNKKKNKNKFKHHPEQVHVGKPQRQPRKRRTTAQYEARTMLRTVLVNLSDYEDLTVEQIAEQIDDFELAWSVLQKHVKHTVAKP